MRALFGVSGIACSLYAASNMPLSDAGAISLTEGVFVVLIAATFLNERVAASRWLGMVLCAIGALIVVKGERGNLYPVSVETIATLGHWPAISAFAGALLEACDFILIKTLSVNERSSTMLLYTNGFGILFLLIPVLLLWHKPTVYQFFSLAMLGPIAISAQYCNVKGFRLAEASLLAPIHYSGVLFAGLIGYSAFGERPSIATAVGSAIVIVGGLVVTSFQARGQQIIVNPVGEDEHTL